MKKIILIVIILIVAAGLVIGLSKKGNRVASTVNTKVGDQQIKFDKTPDLALKDYAAKSVNLSDFTGKPLVLNAWATWCPFCKEELPDFATAQKEFKDQVVIVAIDRAEPLSVAKSYTDARGTTKQLVFLLDPNDSFYSAIGGFSMPETIFVDRQGNIQFHKRGPMDVNEIRQRVQALLEAGK